MSAFKSTASQASNLFVKHKPQMLESFYGTSDVFPYWVADTDFQVASPISDALASTVERATYSYEFNEKGVFSAIANWFDKRHQVSLSADNFVQVPGVLSGIALLLREFTEKGDGVLIHTPAYHQFANLVNKAERTVVSNKLVSDNQSYSIDFDSMEAQIEQHNVKAMIFCNPHNPTGRVWSKQELDKVVEIAERHQVLIIADEIHSDIIYQGHRFHSLTQYDYQNIVTLIGSPAKTFGMHSIANGYIYIDNDELRSAIKSTVAAMYLDHGNALTMYATIAAYTQGEEWLDGMLDYLEGSVKWIAKFLADNMPQVVMYQPEGTYQIWFDFSAYNLPQTVLNDLVFKQAKMGLTPGGWFGAKNHNFMRINIATDRANIERSFELLKQAFENADFEALSGSSCDTAESKGSCC